MKKSFIIFLLLISITTSIIFARKEVSKSRKLIEKSIESLKNLKSYMAIAEVFINREAGSKEKDMYLHCEVIPKLKKRYDRKIGLVQPSKLLWINDYYVIDKSYYAYSRGFDLEKKEEMPSFWKSGGYGGENRCEVDFIIETLIEHTDEFKHVLKPKLEDYNIESVSSYMFTPSELYYYQDVFFQTEKSIGYIFVDNTLGAIKGCYVRAIGKVDNNTATYVLKINYKYNSNVEINIPDISKSPKLTISEEW